VPATREGNFELNPFELLMKDPTIIYSAVGTVQDMRELVDLAADGRVKSHVSRVGDLSDLATILDELEAGKYLGRDVVVMPEEE
jgi:D-arabinose 1-dehydrogenase-like Zn-dependent alcohol dehydrogenase